MVDTVGGKPELRTTLLREHRDLSDNQHNLRPILFNLRSTESFIILTVIFAWFTLGPHAVLSESKANYDEGFILVLLPFALTSRAGI